MRPVRIKKSRAEQALGLVAVLLLVGGCSEDEAVTCYLLGREVPVGGRVDDPASDLSCVCTAEGPGCRPFTGILDGGRLNDLSGRDARPADLGTGGQDQDAEAGGAGGEGGSGGSGGEGGSGGSGGQGGSGGSGGEGGLPTCTGEIRPLGACDTDDTCGYGEGFTCCDAFIAQRTTCACSANGTWSCVDQQAMCASDPGTGRCERRKAVCEARALVIEGVVDGTWGGDALACDDLTDMSIGWREDVLAHINAWRVLADQPSVTANANRDSAAQECAVALEARGEITHNLTPEEPCYSAAAAQAAAGGLIHSQPGVRALSDYFFDFGERNFAGLPHRLWLLSNHLGAVGVGSTDRFSCLYVANGNGAGVKPWIAWPPPGVFPVDAHLADFTGWSIQSDRVRLFGAQVRVTRDGVNLPVATRILEAQGGASFGLAFTPDGWQSEPGIYEVAVDNPDLNQPAIAYTVELIDCAVPEP